MKAFTFITSFFAAITINAAAQNLITGLVVDDADGQPMAGVSITIRDSAGKIKRFNTTKADGVFTLKAPETTAGFRLEASLVGYARRSFPLDSNIDSTHNTYGLRGIYTQRSIHTRQAS